MLSLGGRVTYQYFPSATGVETIARVNGVLAVSRAIGDTQFHPYVTCDPEFMSREIDPKEDLFLVLASDGLFDVMSNEDVSRFVFRKYVQMCSLGVGATVKSAGKRNQTYSKQFAFLARQLCEEASILGSSDNITVQIVDVTI